MIPIGLGAVFAGYWISLWGYCLIRGYNVKFMGLAKATWPAGAAGPGGAPAAHTAPLSPRSPVNPPTSGSLGPGGTVIKLWAG